MGLREFVASLTRGEQEEDQPGWLHAASLRLEVLLRSAGFKGRVRRILSGIDPAHAPALIRKAILTDPSMGLTVLATVPKVGNALILAVQELTLQADRWPPALMANMLRDSLSRLKLGLAGEAAGRYTAQSLAIAAENQDWASLRREFMRGFSQGLRPDQLRDGVVVLAGQLDDFLAEHPDWVQAALQGAEEALRRYPRLRDALLGPGFRLVLDDPGT